MDAIDVIYVISRVGPPCMGIMFAYCLYTAVRFITKPVTERNVFDDVMDVRRKYWDGR